MAVKVGCPIISIIENAKISIEDNLDIMQAISKLVEKQVKYLDITDTDVTLTSKTYLKNTDPITSLSITINADSNDSCLLFTTGSTFEFNATIDASFKINKQFNFEPNKTYLIAVDNYTILWSELYNYEQ
jgi:hypothetical protein